MLGCGIAAGLGARLVEPVDARSLGCEVPPSEPRPFALPDLARAVAPEVAGVAARVAVEGGGYRYRYLVGGRSEIVRGMGYNPGTADRPAADRRWVLERDLNLMRRHGVNTLVGWDPAEFDGLLLDVAAAEGLGVAMPFDFDFEADYEDQATRSRAASQALAWVERYRHHPAVRIWALGNEVLQRSVPPAWCMVPPSDESARRARAFSRFLVELADRVHAADPDHPVLYRDAEDAYVDWIGDALAESPAPRPWLIYGINAYTSRLAEILESWSRHGIDVPLLVTEFALLGAERGARAQGLKDLWSIVRAHPAYVLGGAVYVWYASGPEEVDREFGLVDLDGSPADDALAAIGELYSADAAGTGSASPAHRDDQARPTGADSHESAARSSRPSATLDADRVDGRFTAVRADRDGPVLPEP